jgi:hypothetical protein
MAESGKPGPAPRRSHRPRPWHRHRPSPSRPTSPSPPRTGEPGARQPEKHRLVLRCRQVASRGHRYESAGWTWSWNAAGGEPWHRSESRK